MADLNQEASNLLLLLREKFVKNVERFKDDELLIEFSDGMRLYINVSDNHLELSVTGGAEENEGSSN